MKRTLTFYFGVVGGISWGATVLLREMFLQNESIKFILGVMPNFAATWLFLYLGEMFLISYKQTYTFKFAALISGLIFICGLISEIIHAAFLNSPFDLYDMMATLVAIAIYLPIFYVTQRHPKEATQQLERSL